jgi:hypothetical protein
MSRHRALFLDASHVTCYALQGGQMREEAVFAGDAPGLQGFDEYLRKRRSSIFYLLADVAEEGYQIEEIPFLTGGDRKALLERRLGQYFYGTPLTATISLGRETTGRRDEKILFTALTRPQYFETWFAALRQAECQLAGLFSAPMVVNSLFKTLGKKEGRYLMLTLSKAGLRQSFFQDGQLRFSRLTPLATGSVDEYSVACAVEAARFYQYLVGQRQIERGKRLETLLLVHPAETATFRQKCRDTEELHFEYVDLVERTSKLGLKSPGRDSHADLLLLHLLLKKSPAHQFAPSPERKLYRLWQWRSGLRLAGALIFVLCLLVAGKTFYQAYATGEEVATVNRDAAMTKQRYEDVLKKLPPMPVSADQLRSVVDRFDTLQKNSPAIASTFTQLSRALGVSAQVELDHIAWLPSSNPSDIAGSESSATSKAAPMVPGGASFYVITEIQGHLPVTMANDNRAILDTVNHFADELRKNKGMTVNVVQMPFDLASGKTIKSSAQVGVAQVEPPKFSLRLVQAL